MGGGTKTMMQVTGRRVLPLLVMDESETLSPGPLRGRTKLTKLVFLLQQRRPDLVARLTSQGPAYAFEPLHYGPFSKDLIEDLEAFERAGLVLSRKEYLDRAGRVVQHAYKLTQAGKKSLIEAGVDVGAQYEARRFLDRYLIMDRETIVDLVHEEFPQYLARR